MKPYLFTKKDGKVDTDAILTGVRMRIAALPNGSYELLVRKVKTIRTISQNNLYWKWLGVIADVTGSDTEELHEIFKDKFLPREHKDILGEEVEIIKSTTRLSTQEFADYMTRIEAFVSEFGITLPSPEDLGLNVR